MCSYSDYKHQGHHPMAYGQPGSQFGHHQGGHNWFGQSYYAAAAAAAAPPPHHSYCHGAAAAGVPQHHHQIVPMAAANGPPEPWPHQHHHQPYPDWMHAIHQAPCQLSGGGGSVGDYSTAEDSDVTPSPASNRTVSPAYNVPARGRSPYEWMKKSSFQSEPSPGKTRTKDKYRVVYTDQQRVELEKEFLYNKYITIRRKTEMAASLGLSERQVKIWFQNRRAKQRKQDKKKQDLVQYKTADSMSVNSLMILN